MEQNNIKLVLYPKLHFVVYVIKLSILLLIFYNIYRITIFSGNTNGSDELEMNVLSVEDSLISEGEVISEGEEVHTDKQMKDKASSPLLLLWNNYQETGNKVYSTIFDRITSGECKATCRITMDKTRQNESSAIIFHMPDLHWEGYNFPRYRDPGQPWVLMTYESGNSIRQRSYYKGRFPVFDGRKLAGVINRTMTIREDSDIVVRHGYTVKRSEPLSATQLEQIYSQVPRKPVSDFLPSNVTISVQPPAPVAWFVSHCKDFDGRLKYVHWLQKFMAVDIYGECGPLSCGTSRNMGHTYRLQDDPCFHIVNSNYRFYLSFENAICQDYVTEKIFNALRLNTIPIVLGGANYTKILPPGSFINAGDFDSPKDLANFLQTVLNNSTLYESYFSWRPFYDIHSFTSVPDNCALCEQLSSGKLEEKKTYLDMFSWLVREAHCVYTKPSWGLTQYQKIWAEAGRRSAKGH